MKISKWEMLYSNYSMVSNFINNMFLFKAELNKLEYNELKKNISLKDKYKGRRCFIIGNGPSTKSQDLTLLRNEIVFTVNYFTNSDIFPEVFSNYHFWMDPNLFRVKENFREEEYLISSILRAKTSNNNPICIFPIAQKHFIQEHNIDKDLDILYVCPKLGFMYEGFDERIELTRFIPQFGTVVQLCIITAIYMGMENIILIGCDNTGIVNSINSLVGTLDNIKYSYPLTSIEKTRMRNGALRNGIEREVFSYLQDIKGFRILNEYCNKRNINLVNASASTVIDSLRRVEYVTLFN